MESSSFRSHNSFVIISTPHQLHSIIDKMRRFSYLLVLFSLLTLHRVARACLPDFSNTCGSSRDCCSQNCWRGNPNWATGVCQPGTGGGPTGAAAIVSEAEFNQAVTSNGFPTPRRDQYVGFTNGLPKGGIDSKREAAMVLAQLLHESAGLTAKEEIACRVTKCPGDYTNAGCEVPGQFYYGRGYIQLSWCYNYRDASRGLGLGDLLLRQPDLVVTNEQYSWDTAFWFWRERVRNGPYGNQVRNGEFGASTKAINGGEECNGRNRDKAVRRFQLYQNVYRAFQVPGQPDERGCY